MALRQDADRIMAAALKAAQPDSAVKKALQSIRFEAGGRLVLVALGKAAWQMAFAASQALGGRIDRGIVITKDGQEGPHREPADPGGLPPGAGRAGLQGDRGSHGAGARPA